MKKKVILLREGTYPALTSEEIHAETKKGSYILITVNEADKNCACGCGGKGLNIKTHSNLPDGLVNYLLDEVKRLSVVQGDYNPN